VDPATITLEDVIELVEGPIAISKCLAGDLECPRKGECPMQPIWIEAQQAFVDVLRSRTIADLVQNTPEKEASGRKYMSGVE
jgi:DNA-binding IscR family transcriptional regulator